MIQIHSTQHLVAATSGTPAITRATTITVDAATAVSPTAAASNDDDDDDDDIDKDDDDD